MFYRCISPSPVAEEEVLLELSLSHLDQLPLLELLRVPRHQHTLEHFSLELPDQVVHQLVPALLHHTEGTRAEEDDGVPEPVTVAGEVNLVHESVHRLLVVIGGG